jgi:hypothetical protein
LPNTKKPTLLEFKQRWLFNFCAKLFGQRSFDGNGRAAKTVYALQPVFVEWRVDDALGARGVIKTVLVGDDAYVRLVAEEDERAELELLILTCGRKA